MANSVKIKYLFQAQTEMSALRSLNFVPKVLTFVLSGAILSSETIRVF